MLLGLAFVTGSVAAKDDAPPAAMKFHGQPPHSQFKEESGGVWTFFADGQINAGTADALKKYMKDNQIPKKSTLVLNSTGSTPVDGMKLGIAIRDADLTTNIGKDLGEDDKHLGAGQCSDACALAFLGGTFRWIEADSVYGVRKSFLAVPSNGDGLNFLTVDVAQYIHDVDVDAALLHVLQKADSASVTPVPHDDLFRLGAINNGETRTVWMAGSTDTTLYLRGERKTPHGINKVIFTCSPPGPLMMYIVFDPDGRADDIRQMTEMSLILDDSPTSFVERRLIGPELLHGWIVAMFAMDDRMLDAIQAAKTVGFSFQFKDRPSSATGFSQMHMRDAAKKLKALRPECQ